LLIFFLPKNYGFLFKFLLFYSFSLFKQHAFYQIISNLIIECLYIFKCRLEGEVVEKALAMNKPVLNVQWLNDILFGGKLSITDPRNIKYQQFDLCDPFLVNYDMVSHLMGMV